jgi:hypothetical protein
MTKVMAGMFAAVLASFVVVSFYLSGDLSGSEITSLLGLS